VDSRHRADVANATAASQSRRVRWLSTLLIAGLVLIASIAISACGNSESSGGSTGSTQVTETGGSETGGATGKEVSEVLGLKEGPDTGKGEKWKIGSVLALTGSGSFYGKVMTQGIELAVAQIKAAGGPEIEVDYKDNKSGNAQAGAQAGKELGIAKTPAVLSSYAGDIGSLFPSLQQYKMLGIDPGGGTSDFGQEKPYFWGTRAIEPDDDWVGAFKYWKETNPSVKSVALVYIDQGPVNEIVEANFKKSLEEEGLEFAGAYATPIGNTDYTSTISEVKSSGADAVFTFLIGEDAGYFMKQYVNAGLEMPVIGSEYVPEAEKIAGAAFEKYDFSTDWFFAKEPTNPWSKLFAKSFEDRFGEEPNYYAANFYESTFLLWELFRRVKESGGDVNNGEDLQKALEEDPKFPSVYGGSANEVGEVSLDLKTHSVNSRPLAVLATNGGEPKKLATFELGGADFELAK
jgi:ABC-type branched-subunit amino acid transport system substrate-binding protein